MRTSAGNWMQSQTLSGGYMMDFGIHLVDFCRFLFKSEATMVESFGGKYINKSDPINDYETMVIEFGEDKMAQINRYRTFKNEWKGISSEETP